MANSWFHSVSCKRRPALQLSHMNFGTLASVCLSISARSSTGDNSVGVLNTHRHQRSSIHSKHLHGSAYFCGRCQQSHHSKCRILCRAWCRILPSGITQNEKASRKGRFSATLKRCELETFS